MTFAIIATGGTGGHIYPALALARVLEQRGHATESLHFVGGRRGMEGQVVPAAGFAIDRYPGRGLRRSMHPSNLVALAQAAATIPRALSLVRRLRPRVVVGFGGYTSFAVLAAASALRIPRIVHESDAVAGLTNRLLSRLGASAATSLEATDLPRSTVTGNPVRPEILDVVWKPETPPLVAVVGGSLGARSVNEAALELFDRWRGRDDVAVHHVSGARDHDWCVEQLADLRRAGDRLAYLLVEYETDMPSLLRRAAVVVGRAGASTVSELTAVGVPSVLVPLPGAPGDHQTHNARAIESAGGAVVITDAECRGATLHDALSSIVGESSRRDEMAVAARSLARRDAAERLADLVEECARA